MAQLAELWPDGWMDNNGIKHAVQRAKDRKKKLIKANIVRKDLFPPQTKQKHNTKTKGSFLISLRLTELLSVNMKCAGERRD